MNTHKQNGAVMVGRLRAGEKAKASSTTGERIRARRLAQRISQATIARQLRVSQALVSRWELDKSEVSEETMARLAKLLKTHAKRLRGPEWIARARGGVKA